MPGFGVGLNLHASGQGDGTFALETHSYQALGLSITLGSGQNAIYMASIRAAISSYSQLVDVAGSSVNSLTAYRVASGSSDGLYDAGRLEKSGLIGLSAAGSPLLHEYGHREMHGLEAKLRDGLEYWRDVIGMDAQVGTWPYHVHDRLSMGIMRDLGCLAMRSGTGTNSYYANGHFFFRYNNEAITKTWSAWCPWSVPLQAYLDNTNVNTVSSKADLTSLLYDTANFQTTPASPLHSQASLMDLWKANHTWAMFYCHDEVTATNLRWLLEIMRDDADVLVGTMGEIATLLHQTHTPDANDPLIYRPMAAVPDGPYAGKKMAFSFVTDDGRVENLTSYLGICNCVGVRWTAACITHEEGELTDAQIAFLHGAGACEIGTHFRDVERNVLKNGFTMVNSNAARLAVMVDTASPRTMAFYCHVDDLSAHMGMLPGMVFGFEPWRWVNTYAEGAAINNWICPYTTTSGAAGGTASPRFTHSTYLGLPAARFNASSLQYLNLGEKALWHNSYGLTVYAAMYTDASCNRSILARRNATSNQRAFLFQYWRAEFSFPTSYQAFQWSTGYASNTITLLTLRWDAPAGTAHIHNRGNNTPDLSSSSLPTSLTYPSGVNAYIGSQRAGNLEPFHGDILGLWCFDRFHSANQVGSAHAYLRNLMPALFS